MNSKKDTITVGREEHKEMRIRHGYQTRKYYVQDYDDFKKKLKKLKNPNKKTIIIIGKEPEVNGTDESKKIT